MKTFKSFASLLLAVALLTGCYEDQGNYDYKPINTLDVDIPSSKYTVVSGSTLDIKPVITFADGSTDESTLRFEWKLSGEVISTDRNLAFVADRIAISAPLHLRVCDTRTGITSLATTNVDLTEKHNVYGWMILSDDNGASRLTYLSQQGSTVHEYVVYKDVFQTENGRELGSKPVRLLEHFFYTSKTSSFWIVQQGGECVDLKGDDLKVDVELSTAFLDPAFGQSLKIKQIAELRWLTIAVDQDGKAYTRKKEGDKSYHSGKFLNYPLAYAGTDLYVNYFIDWRTIKTGGVIMLEGKPGSQRLLAVSGYDKASAGKVMPLTVSGAGYPANFTARADNFGDHQVLFLDYFLIASPTAKNAHALGVILKAPDGKYLYQEYYISDTSGQGMSATPNRQLELDIASKIDPAGHNVFYFAPYTNNPNFFLSNGRTLYYINRASLGQKQMLEVKTFDSEIVAIDGESSGYGQMIGVGLANGDFYVLNQKDNNAVVHQTQTASGRIVDVRYKIKSVMGWPN